MTSVLIVGSGATGVHFAQTCLERGLDVLMLDVGHARPDPVLPSADFDGLKTGLEDPVEYFLGSRGEAIVYPSGAGKLYGFPPSKSYVFQSPTGFAAESQGFEPVTSFAAGGLAEAWTGGVYPLNDAELEGFPCSAAELEPYYREVARRIGISGVRDDLARFSPFFDEYQPALDLDRHSSLLIRQYERKRSWLNQRLKFFLGRSRVAVLSQDLEDRKSCDYLGRCLWGCPRESLYAPGVTLRRLRQHPRFRYVGGVYVEYFRITDGKVDQVVATPISGGERLTYSADHYVLAAGTLCTSRIVLETHYRATGEIATLPGLMDNRQIMMPFITLRMLGQPASTHSYQFHQIALGIAGRNDAEYVHGQITALKSASVHPIVQSMPVDMRSAIAVFQSTHAALGVANIWLHDRPRADNILTIRPGDDGRVTLVIRHGPAPDDMERVRQTLSTTRRALWKLGAIVPPGMTRILGQGSSIHYAGTMPMTATPLPFTTSPVCRSHDYANLTIADGASFPFLPAKNLTYTLMANAIRAAQHIAV